MNRPPYGPVIDPNRKESRGTLFPPEEVSTIDLSREIQQQAEIDNPTNNVQIIVCNYFLRLLKRLVVQRDKIHLMFEELLEEERKLSLVIDRYRESPEIKEELISFRNKLIEWLDKLKKVNIDKDAKRRKLGTVDHEGKEPSDQAGDGSTDEPKQNSHNSTREHLETEFATQNHQAIWKTLDRLIHIVSSLDIKTAPSSTSPWTSYAR